MSSSLITSFPVSLRKICGTEITGSPLGFAFLFLLIPFYTWKRTRFPQGRCIEITNYWFLFRLVAREILVTTKLAYFASHIPHPPTIFLVQHCPSMNFNERRDFSIQSEVGPDCDSSQLWNFVIRWSPSFMVVLVNKAIVGRICFMSQSSPSRLWDTSLLKQLTTVFP